MFFTCLSQEFSILFGSYYFTVSYLITHGLIAWSVLLARGKGGGLFVLMTSILTPWPNVALDLLT